jgi:hypothetical protein
MTSSYRDPNVTAALAYQVEQEQRRKAQEQPSLLDVAGRTALGLGVAALAGAGIRGVMRRNAMRPVSVEDLGATAARAEENVRRAARSTATPPPSRPALPADVARQQAAEEFTRQARAERPTGINQIRIQDVVPTEEEFVAYRPDPKEMVSSQVAEARREAATLALLKASQSRQEPYQLTLGGEFSPTLQSIRSSEFGPNLTQVRERALGLVPAEAPSRPLAIAPDQLNIFSPRSYIEQTGSIEPTLKITPASLVEKQQARTGFNVDQAINAIDAAEDQQTGRVKIQLQRNEDLDMGQVEVLEDIASQQRNFMMEQDEPINSVAVQLPDGLPIDQAEGALSFAQNRMQQIREAQEAKGYRGLRAESEMLQGAEGTRLKQASELYAATGDPNVLSLISEAPSLPIVVQPKGQQLVTAQSLKGDAPSELSTSSLYSPFKARVADTDTQENVDVRMTNRISGLGATRESIPKTIINPAYAALEEETNMAMYGMQQGSASAANIYNKNRQIFREGKAPPREIVNPEYLQLSQQIDEAEAVRGEARNIIQKKQGDVTQFPAIYKVADLQEGARAFYQQTPEGQIIPETLEVRGGRKAVPFGVVEKAASGSTIRGTGSTESYSPILSTKDIYGIQRSAMGASATSPEAAIPPSSSPSAWRLPAGSRKQGKQTINVVVAGGREYENYPELSQKLDQTISQLNIPEGMSVNIVSGGARGADTLAEKYAQERGLGLQVFPANWNEKGLSAGTLRNTQMAKEGDVLVAFPGGTGTENMIQQMTQDFGKPAYRAADIVTQAPTPQGQESFDVSRQLRQLQLTGRPGEAQDFLDRMLKQRGVSSSSGMFSPLR